MRKAIARLTVLGVNVAVRHWFLASGNCVPVKPLTWFFNSPRFKSETNIFTHDLAMMKKIEEQMQPYLESFENGTVAELAAVQGGKIILNSGVQWMVLTNEAAIMFSVDDERNRNYISLCERVDAHFLKEISKLDSSLDHPCPVADEWLPLAIVKTRLSLLRGCFDIVPITDFFFRQENDTGPYQWESTTVLVDIPDGSSRRAHDKGLRTQKTLAEVLKLAADDKATGFFRKVEPSADICSLFTDDFKMIDVLPPATSALLLLLSSSSSSSSSSLKKPAAPPSMYTETPAKKATKKKKKKNAAKKKSGSGKEEAAAEGEQETEEEEEEEEERRRSS